jgi:hypothetical protein
VRYHPLTLDNLTPSRDPAGGPWQPVSFTGAVSSQRVTEEREGWLSTVGNRVSSVMAQASLTVRPTSRADTKVGHSDPAVESGIAVAQRIKGTLGITG